MNTGSRITRLIYALLGLVACASVGAQELDTLRKIKASNTIVIGYRDASIPFSYLGENGQPIGYSIDLCSKIVDAIRLTQKMSKLEIKFALVSTATRIPKTANGTVDIECGSSTNDVERHQQVSFLVTTFVTTSRVAWKKSANFKSLADLKGKTIAAAAGTNNLKEVTAVNIQRQLGMTIVPTKNHFDAFAMLEKGDAAAFASDDILIYSTIAESAAPTSYVVSSEALSTKPKAIMVRKDDPAFKKVADDAIRALYKSGEIQKIYSKWFLSPIPPKKVNLNVAMSDSLKKAIAKPTDSGIPSDY